MSDFIPDRMNEPPSVFNGCSWEELGALAGTSFVTSFVLGILLALITSWLVILLSIVVGTLFGIYFGSIVMLRLKSGKPPGYYKTKFHIILQDLGVKPRSCINKSRVWDIRSD